MLSRSRIPLIVCSFLYVIPAALSRKFVLKILKKTYPQIFQKRTVYFSQILWIFSEAIPYSYASGRDVAAVEARYNKFQAAKANNASTETLLDICGRVANYSAQQCTTQVGRPKNSESLACDSLCCLAGSKVGNCGADYGIQLNPDKLLEALQAGVASGGIGYSAIVGAMDVKLAANCYCSDDPIDVRCGRDGSFIGIRCPFDTSACWRKCCREGKNSGKCEGIFRSKCNCS